MKIDLQNFCLKNDNGNFKIEINPDVEIPDNLYKYYYLNRNSLNVLKENILHFSHSFMMNDIMDGSFLLWDMETFVDDLMIRHNIPKQKKRSAQKFIIQQFSDEFLKHLGIFCACDNYSNDLLWSHYTNEKGFCIEIDTTTLLAELEHFQTYFFPINYGELKQIDLLEFSYKTIVNKKVNADANIPIFYSLANKEDFWKYEKEWRIIIRDQSFEKVTNAQVLISKEEKEIEKENLKKRNIPIPKSVFKKIILSTIFFDNSRFKSSKFNGMQVKYFFAEGEGKSLLIEFFEILKSKYSDKLFQVDKYLNDGKILRDITYHILILEVNQQYVELVRRNSSK